MITRSSARTALAELEQKQQQQVQSTTFVKPVRKPGGVPRKPSFAATELQQVEALAKKMDVISIGSSSEEHGAPGDSRRDAIDLSESSKSVTEISSAADDHEDDSEDSFSSEDDDEEITSSEDDNHGRRISSSSCSTPANRLLADEVAKLIRGGDMKKLKVDDCRAYLRNYGLRVAGTKPVLVDRIKQHIELTEGGSGSYAKSTFTKDCTGDVCKGDVVLFQQKVYDKFCTTSRSARQKGRRTVAGRVVKESYGAQRQQHTFTVEVLWSAGFRALPPMKQLLVKGRNLYKRRARRQEWADEEERERSLAEKHERGAAARQVRAMKRGRFKGTAVSSIGFEGPVRKQLANPYTNTLSSKEICDFSSRTTGFQSAVEVGQFAAGSTQQLKVNPHALLVSTGANSVPLGKVRQFGQLCGHKEIDRVGGGVASTGFKSTIANSIPLGDSRHVGQFSGNGVINSAAGGVASTRIKPSGATTKALGKVRQFGPPTETSGTNRASGGPTTTMVKHRQWFKPALPSDHGARTQQGCKGLNASSSSPLPGGTNGPQAEACDPGQSGSVRAPISTSTAKGAGLAGVGIGSHDGKTSSLMNKPSSQYYNTSEFSSRPSSPYHNISSSPSSSRHSSPYFMRISSPYHSRPSSPSHGRAGSPLVNRTSSPFPIPHNNIPSSSFPNRPSYPISHRPTSPYQNRPASPIPGKQSYLNSSKPPSPSVWEGVLRPSPSTIVPGRPALPSLKIASIMDRGLLGSAPASYSPDQLAWPPLNRQPSSILSVGQNGSHGSKPTNGSHVMEDCYSTKWKTTHRWTKLSQEKGPQNGFPCPTALCGNLGSRQCSSGVCYYCCQKKGGACRNPRH